VHALDLFLRGALAGLAISAPVGPVNVMVISRALAKGPRAGMIAGLGAAAADSIYGGIAAFSISLVIGFLIREESWIRVVGGILLMGIGVVYACKRPGKLTEQRRKGSKRSDFGAALFLNLTNPTTVLSFLAVLAVLRMSEHRAWWLTWLVLVGIFCGGMAWWIFVSVLAGHFRDRFNDGAMRWMNRIAGAAIGGFGALTLILGLLHRG
jgi:threonine/homoserine/homoserine lactone efflux protein